MIPMAAVVATSNKRRQRGMVPHAFRRAKNAPSATRPKAANSPQDMKQLSRESQQELPWESLYQSGLCGERMIATSTIWVNQEPMQDVGQFFAQQSG